MKLPTRNVALVAIFAALHYVLSLIRPYVPAVAIPEINISLEALIALVFGLVLGPYLAALAAFLGAFVAWTLPLGGMGPYVCHSYSRKTLLSVVKNYIRSKNINQLATAALHLRLFSWRNSLT